MELQNISVNNIIDTTTEENIEKYKNNLSRIINETKEKGMIDKFVLIRNDDFFPEDYEWKVNSKNTNGEYRELTRLVLGNGEDTPKRNFFDIIFKRKKEEEVNEVIDEVFMLHYPVQFRSTKHFTINTALGMTGEYNLVNSNRKFTIIDSIDNFVNSGYGYSLSEKDAYLDVTHEPLKISNNAIILISEETYNEIKDNKELIGIMSQRRVVIYKGDINLAINMILSENGILPFRSEFQYDDDTKGIIKNSLKELCNRFDLDYDRPHGMSSDAHFTSFVDQYDDSSEKLIKAFVDFINFSIGNNLVDINEINRQKFVAWRRYIQEIGVERFKEMLNQFNLIQKEELKERKKKYKTDRKKITPEISRLFKETLRLIRENENELNFMSDYNENTKIAIEFFLADDLQTQIECATKINSFLSEKKRNV